ncbi:inositol monophosphatase family protein [Acaricomes phytoseiuli]|uniref:inositol monophosphatase family protein n=1 Tax=Acaricomes phytoseiuli TaxID=291968 RepID=UPI0003685B71|nr:inositol monophosphatase family protein [Acaricomes phytoseiuli]MCW1249477.1 inositol monophosphatase family protein [Acaricomes phytoseiuli]
MDETLPVLSELELPDLDADLDDSNLAAQLVRTAGQLAYQMRAQGLQGQRKTTVSDVVTAADQAAEEYIVAQLTRVRPDDGILGEEGAARASRSGRSWVIDPVDGTYNFLSGLSYWCSAIALRRDVASTGAKTADPEVILGAVYQIQEDKLWLGGEALAATLNGRPISVAAAEDSTASGEIGALGQISAATYLHPSWLAAPDAREPWLAAAQKLATIRMLGSGSCDLSRVAQGELGCWFQHSTAEWDWLPGKAIVRAAGGATETLEVRGLRWFLAGSALAVAELSAALRGG